MWDRLSGDALLVLSLAARLAKQGRKPVVEPLHVLAALAIDERSALASILRRHGLGVSSPDRRERSTMPYAVGSSFQLSERVSAIVEPAWDFALRRGETDAAAPHIALALLRSNDPQVENVLIQQQIDVRSLVREILLALGGSNVLTEMCGEQYDLSKWSGEAQRIVRGSQYECGILRTDYIGSEHVLLSLLRDAENPAAQFLEAFYPIPISIAGISSAVKAVCGAGGRTLSNGLRFTINAMQLVSDAQVQARRIGRSFVSAEHILLGVLANRGCSAARALSKRVDLDRLERSSQKLRRPVRS